MKSDAHLLGYAMLTAIFCCCLASCGSSQTGLELDSEKEAAWQEVFSEEQSTSPDDKIALADENQKPVTENKVDDNGDHVKGGGSPVASQSDQPKSSQEEQIKKQEKKGAKKLETATFGAGCFWCVEAVFKELKGVSSVESGYCNGAVPNPTYRQVCTGQTGHAEVVRIKFDPEVVSFQTLLEVFWKTHDPTTLNRQGADTGTQYRSGVYFHSEEQKKTAEEIKKKLDEAKIWSRPIVTEIVKAEEFYKAEDYHQDYFELNGSQPYCRAVIVPKMEKFRKVFKDLLKE